MNLLQVSYDKEENIKDISINMTFTQAVALQNILGKLNGHAHTKLRIDSDMYECLSDVMNRHFDDGTPDLHITLETLNEG